MLSQSSLNKKLSCYSNLIYNTSVFNVISALLYFVQEICIGILGNMACVETICAEGFGDAEQMYVRK